MGEKKEKGGKRAERAGKGQRGRKKDFCKFAVFSVDWLVGGMQEKGGKKVECAQEHAHGDRSMQYRLVG